MDPDRIKAAAHDGLGKVETMAGQFGDSVAAQVRGVANEAAGAVQSAYGRAKDTARSTVDQAPATFAGAVDAGQQQLQAGARRLESGVAQRPLISLLVAGTVGFLLAKSMQRPR